MCVCAEHSSGNKAVSTKAATTRRGNAQKQVTQVGAAVQAQRKKKYI